MRIKLMTVDEIFTNWRTIRPMLEPALKDCKDYFMPDLERMLQHEQWKLYGIFNKEEKLQGAVVVTMIQYARDRVAFITAIGGRGLARLHKEFFEMLKAAGADRVQGAGKPSIVRLWRTIGMHEEYAIVEKTL